MVVLAVNPTYCLMNRFYSWVLICWLCTGSAFAQIIISAEQDRYVIGNQVSILADPSRQLTLADVHRGAYREQFEPSKEPAPNRGFSTANHWVRFRVKNTDPARKYLLEVGFGNFAHVTLYQIRPDGQIYRVVAGDHHPGSRSPVASPTFVFELPVPPGEAHLFYLQFESEIGQMFFPLTIWENRAFIDYAQKSALLWGLYYGFLLIIFVYHLLVTVFTRQRLYLYLTLYLLAYLFYEITRGYNIGVRYFWPENRWLVTFGISLTAALVTNLFLHFYCYALRLRQSAPVLFFMMRSVGLLSAVAVILNVTQVTSWSQQQINYFPALVGTALILVAGVQAWWRGRKTGDRPALYYLAAAISLTTGLVLMFLNRLNVIPGTEFFSHYTLNLGSVIEMLFLSFGAADTLRQARRRRRDAELEKRRAQERELEMQRALIETLRERKEELEQALVEGQTIERGRVAGDLHDSYGARLSALRWQYMSINQRALSADDQDTFQRACEELDKIYKEIRLVSQNLAPVELLEDELGTSLQKLVRGFSASAGVTFELIQKGEIDGLPPRIAFELYCIAMELANNVLKHAQARRAWIELEGPVRGFVQLTVSDDGQGFPAQADTDAFPRLRSVGNRLKSINGTYRVEPRSGGSGTRVRVQVPV
jgi:signal transduction histidine kinase